MKKTMKKILSVLLACTLFFSLTSIASAQETSGAAPSADCGLKFNENHEFVILQVADFQDDIFPRVASLMELEKALDTVKPDLVIFTGDNTSGQWTKLTSKIAIEKLLAPLVERGVKFTFVFGNHDGQRTSKDYQFTVYQSIAGCLAYDADPNMFGCGNHNLVIKSSDGARTVFNLWLIDSNMDNDELDTYEPVQEDQLEWYKTTSEQLEQENSGLVPSLVFQHIPVPQIYELLVEAPEGTTEGTKTVNGKTYLKELNPELATGTIGEWPCPSYVNYDELDTFAERGDVLGIVTGHDHVNSFIGAVDGIDLIQSPGCGFQTYGDEQRGYRVITLNENNPWSYETYTTDFADYFGEGFEADFIFNVYGSPFGILAKAVIDVFKGIINSLGIAA